MFFFLLNDVQVGVFGLVVGKMKESYGNAYCRGEKWTHSVSKRRRRTGEYHNPMKILSNLFIW
jgi:hypothetical protein